MKKTLSIFIAAILLTSINLYSQFSGGTGTQADPYQITSRQDMEALADSVNNLDQAGTYIASQYGYTRHYNWSYQKYFKLMNDITDSIRMPIGQYYLPEHTVVWVERSFEGNFDGNNKKINLAIDSGDALITINNTALFAVIRFATIKSLSTYGYVIGAADNTAAIVARTRSYLDSGNNISSCNNYATVIKLPKYTSTLGIAGIVGRAESTIIDSCNNYASFGHGGVRDVAGIASEVHGENSSVTNCNNYGNLTCETGAGIIGTGSAKLIENCHNYANIIGNAISGVGGGARNTMNCTNWGSITSTGFAMGIGGGNINCINFGNVYGKQGAIGIGGAPVISNCINIGNINANEMYGNIYEMSYYNAGISLNGKNVTNCMNLGHIGGYEHNAGIMVGYVGYNNRTIFNCINAGYIEGYAEVAGIATAGDITISNCLNTGVIAKKSYLIVLGDAEYDNIENRNVYVGVGFGDITAEQSALGIAGGASAIVQYTTIQTSPTITNCFYDKQMCTVGGVNGKDTPGAKGLLTSELVGDKLRAILKDVDWIYTSDLYPMIKSILADTNLLMRMGDTASWVGASPAYLDDTNPADYDVANKIRTDFTVSTQNQVDWSSKYNNVKIVGTNATLQNNGREELNAGIGKYKKLIPININSSKFAPTDTLVIEAYKDVFFPKSVTDNITMSLAYTDSTVLITLTNFNIPKPDIEQAIQKWFMILGDVMFDQRDYSPLRILKAKIAALPENELKLIDGSLRLRKTGINIWAEKHEFVGYTTTNFKMPIHINSTANLASQDTSGLTLDTLRINVDKNIFILKSTNNGQLLTKINNDSCEITLTNIKLPRIESYNDIILLTLTGDVIFNQKTYSDIDITKATFNIAHKIWWQNLTDGYLKLIEPIFTIRASEHKQIDPNSKDYEIPIYISASENLPTGLIIDKLVVDIDRTVFFPKSVDNGTILLKNINNIRQMTFTNIAIPSLTANNEQILMNIKGDVLLGDKDSSAIDIVEAKLSDVIKINELKLINGYITIDICREGGDRLLLPGNVPYVHIVVNPAKTMLYVNCQTLEVGEHKLIIVDILGNKTEVKNWNVSQTGSRFFEYEITITQYSEGTYTIIMQTPTNEFMDNFVVIK